MVKQFFSVIDGRIGQCGAAQHVGDFLHASFFVQLDDMAAGALRVVFLVYLVCRAAESRDLGQMGYADDLSVECSHFLHDMRHLLGDAAGDAGIYFVENDGR